METNNKPDFRILAEQYADSKDRRMTSCHQGIMHGYSQGCEKIWNDYVISERKHNAEMQTIRIEWRDNAIDKINENQALKSELHKAIELLSRCVGEIPELLLSEVCEFIKDKR